MNKTYLMKFIKLTMKDIAYSYHHNEDDIEYILSLSKRLATLIEKYKDNK